ncbi:MAG: TIGR03984 family CRISPR-associated protein, partial [Chloroflexi bacterium]
DDIIDEDQILWGDTVDATSNGFTLLREGSQGMRHAVPIVVTPTQLKHHQLRLRVRHYISENEDGEASITLSRLVQLLPEA